MYFCFLYLPAKALVELWNCYMIAFVVFLFWFDTLVSISMHCFFYIVCLVSQEGCLKVQLLHLYSHARFFCKWLLFLQWVRFVGARGRTTSLVGVVFCWFHYNSPETLWSAKSFWEQETWLTVYLRSNGFHVWDICIKVPEIGRASCRERVYCTV